MRTLRLALAVAVALGVIVVPGQALAGAVKITKIYFNPPGSDTLTNSKINQERVVFCNQGGRRRGMSRWKLTDKGPDHTFRFPQDFKLGSQRCVTVHTGRGSNTGKHLYMKLGNYVWNNDGDKATLKKRSGVRVDACSYGSIAASPKAC